MQECASKANAIIVRHQLFSVCLFTTASEVHVSGRLLNDSNKITSF